MRISDWSSDVCSSDLGLFVSMNSPGKEGAAGAIRSALFHEFADRYLPGEAVPAARVDAKTAREHAAMLAGHYVSSRGSFTNFISLFGLLGQAEIVVNADGKIAMPRSEEHTSELQSLMRLSYAVFCLKKKNNTTNHDTAPATTQTEYNNINTTV